MIVKIFSRDKILEMFEKQHFIEEAAVISFYDPPNAKYNRAMPIDYQGKPAMLFQVAVNDIDKDVLSEYGFTYDTFFTEAEELGEFIMEAVKKNVPIICQCEYGQSRSAGCAAAILEFFEKKGISIFANYNYYPNQLIYHKVYEGLQKCAK